MNTKLKSYLKHPASLAVFVITNFAAFLTIFVLGFIVVYIVVKGVPHLTPSLFAWEYNSENVSMLPSIINTLLLTALALVIATPLGIFSAIYMVEYAKKGNKIVNVVRITAETLSGIPSIVYGLFGMLFFVGTCRFGYSLLSGAFTVAIMVLPTIMRTTEEALLSVPKNYREGSFGLGAGKLRTVFKVVLPSAVPGILSGVILATGRIVGETAALIYTAGQSAPALNWSNWNPLSISSPISIFRQAETLAVHIWKVNSEGTRPDATAVSAGSAAVLLIFILIFNFGARRLGAYLHKKLTSA